jgi:hypothetical protein
MKYFLFAICILMLNGCSKEEHTLYIAFLINSTAHNIEIHPYFAGIVPADKIITLNGGGNKEIANGMYRGTGKDPVFLSEYMTGADSLVVIFDQLYSITHYGNPPLILNTKHYFFSSPRNIGNVKNYQIESRKLGKHSIENKFTFIFIEQDYLDAK